MMLPLQNITHVISPVMHPIFSDYQNDINQLSIFYEKVVRFLSLIGFPLSVLLWFTAKEITLIIFGEQWESSISIFQILTLSVGIQIIMSTSGSIFQAVNDTRSLFICGLFSTILNILGIIIGIYFFQTLEAVAWCISITFTINFVQCYTWMYMMVFKQCIRIFFKQLLPSILLTALLIVSLLPVYYLSIHLPLFFSLILKCLVFMFISVVYIQKYGEYDLINLLKSKLKR